MAQEVPAPGPADARTGPPPMPTWMRVVLGVAAGAALAFLLLHLLGAAPARH